MREFRTAVLRFLLFVEFPSLSPIQVALTTAFLKIPFPLLSVPSLLCYSTGAVLVGLSCDPLCGVLPYYLTVGVAGASRRVRDYGSKKAASLRSPSGFMSAAVLAFLIGNTFVKNVQSWRCTSRFVRGE